MVNFCHAVVEAATLVTFKVLTELTAVMHCQLGEGEVPFWIPPSSYVKKIPVASDALITDVPIPRTMRYLSSDVLKVGIRIDVVKLNAPPPNAKKLFPLVVLNIPETPVIVVPVAG